MIASRPWAALIALSLLLAGCAGSDGSLKITSAAVPSASSADTPATWRVAVDSQVSSSAFDQADVVLQVTCRIPGEPAPRVLIRDVRWDVKGAGARHHDELDVAADADVADRLDPNACEAQVQLWGLQRRSNLPSGASSGLPPDAAVAIQGTQLDKVTVHGD